MQDIIDNIIDFFWKNACGNLMSSGDIPPTILGFNQTDGDVHTFQDLIPNILSFDWSDPEDRFKIYCNAFKKMKANNYNGLVSITESWITMINEEEANNLDFNPMDINSSSDLLKYRSKFPEAFDRTESLTMYIELEGQTVLVWGRIYRKDNNDPASRVTHISEYVEFKEGEIDGLIKEARDYVYGN